MTYHVPEKGIWKRKQIRGNIVSYLKELLLYTEFTPLPTPQESKEENEDKINIKRNEMPEGKISNYKSIQCGHFFSNLSPSSGLLLLLKCTFS